MTEHALIYCADMVRATLAGRKDVTRRVATKSNVLVDGCRVNSRSVLWGYPDWWERLDWVNARPENGFLKVPFPPDGTVHRIHPKWEAGDLIYIKEVWCPLDSEHWFWVGKRRDMLYVGANKHPHRNGSAYRASSCDSDSERCRMELGYRWQSPRFMPKWASRIWREVVSVRGERLHAVTDEDALREGVEIVIPARGPRPLWGVPGMPAELKLYGPLAKLGQLTTDPRWSYETLWDFLNAGRGYPWKSNPLVWRIETKEAEHET